MSNIVFNVFSDGAVFNNGYKNPDKPQFSACGYLYCLNEKVIKEFSEPLGDQTISYAELYGMMKALKVTIERIESLKKNKVPKPYIINVHSDSQFVIKGASEWIYGWVRRGWRNSSGVEVAYKELWNELYNDYIMNKDYKLTFIHVKGHTKNTDFNSLMNDRCDKLAVSEVTKFKVENNFK